MEKEKEFQADLLQVIQKHGGEVTESQITVTSFLTTILTGNEETRLLLLSTIQAVLVESRHNLNDREISALNDLKNLIENLRIH